MCDEIASDDSKFESLFILKDTQLDLVLFCSPIVLFESEFT